MSYRDKILPWMSRRHWSDVVFVTQPASQKLTRRKRLFLIYGKVPIHPSSGHMFIHSYFDSNCLTALLLDTSKPRVSYWCNMVNFPCFGVSVGDIIRLNLYFHALIGQQLCTSIHSRPYMRFNSPNLDENYTLKCLTCLSDTITFLIEACSPMRRYRHISYT